MWSINLKTDRTAPTQITAFASQVFWPQASCASGWGQTYCSTASLKVSTAPLHLPLLYFVLRLWENRTTVAKLAENNNYSFSHNVYYINSTVIIFCKFSSLDNTIEPGLYEKTSNTFIAEPTTSFPFLLNCILLWQICFHVCLKLSSFIWKSRLRPLSHSFFFPFKSDLFLRFSGNNQDSA